MNKRIHEILKDYFGYGEFKNGQEKVIEAILANKDVVGIMPTGAGKSICYQIPALIFPGITLVISPLISLMKDQVDALNQLNIPCTFINSSLHYQEVRDRIYYAAKGKYKLLYIAPERLESEAFRELLHQVPVSFIAVDEAHCVSQWGHDFRPSYLSLAALIHKLNKRPVVSAFTATATEQVKEDIIRLLALDAPANFVTGFDRENLYFAVEKPTDKYLFVKHYLDSHKHQSGIIYAATRKEVDGLHARLKQDGYLTGSYHAGLTDSDRHDNQEAFIKDTFEVMVATNAFGMGIDKSNIQFVIHYNMPKNMESYYQEAGRAGRDGSPAACILLFQPSDIHTQKFLISQMPLSAEQNNAYQKLQEMVSYCYTPQCLRNFILAYFGELDSPDSCTNCSNCLSDAELKDITIEAQKIISCVRRMGENYGASLTAAVLKGSRAKRVLDLGFSKLSTYGLMAEYKAEDIIHLIHFLASQKLLLLTQEQYPVLRVLSKAAPVLKGEEKIFLRMPKILQPQPSTTLQATDATLFKDLRQLRKELAAEENVPPYVIFPDRTLHEMCKYYPIDNNQLLNIAGIGQVKLEKYGDYFIETIKVYVQENNITPNVDVPVSMTPTNNDKTPSYMITYQLYKQGNTIDEIIKERNVKPPTIQDHLIRCYEEGLDINLDAFIPSEYETEIVKAIKELGTERLRPIKDALPDEVDYLAIRAVICKHEA